MANNLQAALSNTWNYHNYHILLLTRDVNNVNIEHVLENIFFLSYLDIIYICASMLYKVDWNQKRNECNTNIIAL